MRLCRFCKVSTERYYTISIFFIFKQNYQITVIESVLITFLTSFYQFLSMQHVGSRKLDIEN